MLYFNQKFLYFDLKRVSSNLLCLYGPVSRGTFVDNSGLKRMNPTDFGDSLTFSEMENVHLCSEII